MPAKPSPISNFCAFQSDPCHSQEKGPENEKAKANEARTVRVLPVEQGKAQSKKEQSEAILEHQDGIVERSFADAHARYLITYGPNRECLD